MPKNLTKSNRLRNILLTVSYEGTHFCGWQIQDGMRTVQGVIEQALEKVHKQKTTLYGSGRTDSGVHAVSQAANFFSPIDSIPIQKYIPALNGILPHDVRIINAQEVTSDFNARFSAVSRTYRYFIDCVKSPNAHDLNYSWSIRKYPHIQTLLKMCSYLQGELDFSTFASAQDQSKSRCRYIENATFFYAGNKLIFEITANAFLWKMVRSLTGTLIHLESQKAHPDYFAQILYKKDRSLCGPTAPPQGLFLWSVQFDGKRVHN